MSNGGLHYTNDPHGMRAGYVYEQAPDGGWIGRPRQLERHRSLLGTTALFLAILLAGMLLFRWTGTAHGQPLPPDRPNPDHRYEHQAPRHHYHPLPHPRYRPMAPCGYGLGGEWRCR